MLWKLYRANAWLSTPYESEELPIHHHHHYYYWISAGFFPNILAYAPYLVLRLFVGFLLVSWALLKVFSSWSTCLSWISLSLDLVLSGGPWAQPCNFLFRSCISCDRSNVLFSIDQWLYFLWNISICSDFSCETLWMWQPRSYVALVSLGNLRTSTPSQSQSLDSADVSFNFGVLYKAAVISVTLKKNIFFYNIIYISA